VPLVQVGGKGTFQSRSQTIKLTTKRLDQFDFKGNSLVLKIDVEDHEFAVLQGASSLFDEGRVRAVYLDGYASASIPDWLRQRGFSLYHGRNLRPCQPDEKPFSLMAIRHG